MIEMKEREGSPLFHVEHFIEGHYTKYNSNSGFVLRDETLRSTPQVNRTSSDQQSQPLSRLCNSTECLFSLTLVLAFPVCNPNWLVLFLVPVIYVRGFATGPHTSASGHQH